MWSFLIVFAVLTALTVNAIRTSRAIDEMEEAEWEAVDDRLKMEMRREETEDDK